MDKKSKAFFIIFGLLIVVMVGVTYWRIMVKKDYIIEAQTDCDPYTQNCFIWKCDQNSSVEGEACTGDAEKDAWHYNIVKKNAGRIPICDPNADENCEALVCGENEPECEQIFCDDKTKVEQKVECNDPVKYTEENPIEEDPVECTEWDIKCESVQQDEESEPVDIEAPAPDDAGSQSE